MLPTFELDLKFDSKVGDLLLSQKFVFFSTAPLPASNPSKINGKDAISQLREALERDGETLDRLLLGGETCDDAFLKRWLKVKRFHVKHTASALYTHAEWRASFVPYGRIHNNEIAKELDAKKVFLQGCDNQGKAVLVVLARRHVTHARDLDQTIKLAVYALDAASALADVGRGKKICILLDFRCLKMPNLDIKAFSAIFDLLQKHYPGRLEVLWVVNAPVFLWAVWNMTRPFIEPSIREKIKFVKYNRYHRSSILKDSVSHDVLPKRYGGSANLVPIELATRKLFNERVKDPSVITQIASMSDGVDYCRETWKEWLIRRNRLSQYSTWIVGVAFYRRMTCHLWLRCKTLLWRRRKNVQRCKQRQTSHQNTDHPAWSLPVSLSLLVLLHYLLILIALLRELVIGVIWKESSL